MAGNHLLLMFTDPEADPLAKDLKLDEDTWGRRDNEGRRVMSTEGCGRGLRGLLAVLAWVNSVTPGSSAAPVSPCKIEFG